MRFAAVLLLCLLCFSSGLFAAESIPVAISSNAPPELRTAAEKGDAQAQFRLAGQYILTLNWAEALPWLQKSAAQGLPRAQFTLGQFYEFGRGVAKDQNLAEKWYEKASAQGEAEAQFRLGEFAHNARPADDKTAASWYRKAAEQGFPRAQMALGRALAEGRGVKKDAQEACFWLTRSMLAGPEDAAMKSACGELGWFDGIILRWKLSHWKPEKD
jgi:TPR repeat protein